MQIRLTQQYFKQFKSEQFELDWASSYEDGYARLLGGNYAACLLDYQLGPRDGLELIREARTSGCQVPIIFLTAETGEDVDRAALEAGAFDYLVKGEISTRTLERALRYSLKLSETLKALHDMATRDPLTRLLNRREMMRILNEEWERSQRFTQPFSLIMLDIDRFKLINDTHGHPAGDTVLGHIGQLLSSVSRSVDRISRWGGEEFAILVLQANRQSGLEAAQRICSSLAALQVTLDTGVKLNVTMSAGVASSLEDAKQLDSLIAAADRALYAAKQSGRNRAVSFAELK